MARRRKTEVKASEKSSHKYVPVRKSSRQIAKKQLEEKKINGYITQISCSNNSEDSKSTSEGHSHQVLSKKNQMSQKKHNKHKEKISSNSVIINNDNAVYSATQYKHDVNESDSQDDMDNAIKNSEKLSPEDVHQVVIGNPSLSSESTSASTKVEPWPEDVVEEMIVCEEMQVEENIADNRHGYSLTQDNVVIEEVLLVNEPNLENKNFVEFTVIQNENGDESMAMASKLEKIPNNEYHAVGKDVNSVHMNKSENSISVMHTDESVTLCSSGNSNTTESNIDKPYINKKKMVLEERNSKKQKSKTFYDKIRKEISESISEKVRLCSIKDDSSSSMEEDNSKWKSKLLLEKNMHVDLSKEDSFNKIDNKLADMQISESSQEIQKLVNDLSNVESADSPIQTPLNLEKLSPVQLNIDDESSSSILDKMEQLHCPNNSVSPHIKEIFSKTAELNNIIKNQEQNILESNSCIDKLQCTDRVLLKSKITQDKKSTSQQKNSEHLTTTDEYQDSEGDNSKVDNEDMKLSSSSENSNDTLLSLTNYKGREFDIKNTINNTSDLDKKIEFRSNESIDISSEKNSSNNSGVRRSSRIRSIGLMKQRSRGRGLVTKPNIDSSKAIQQEKEKVVNNINSSIIQEVKIDNSETQCDKENSSNKVSTSIDTLTPINISYNVTGYDSDSSKPVKVKSRWRRSSELEMGGSNTGFGSIIAPVSMIGSSIVLPSERYAPVNIGESTSSESKHNVINTNVKVCTETEQSKDVPVISSNVSTVSTVAQIPKTIGAKILLPMVLETEDREMEERLSQFEHLQENLYLTERYTNKETKRMVCDCFLTEEEIERGELGCGEDCLNRLLMIECGPRCVVGDRCTNRRFQNCDYAKCEVFRTEKKGFGLRAVADIMAGEFIMEYVGEVVDPKDFRRRAKEYSKDKNRHYYFMALKSDQIIDATMKGNISRFINHSCDPNAETQKWTVNGELRIGFFNTKFIAAGEEITFDYHFQRYGKEAQKCYCEAQNCRGWIGETPEEEKEKIEKKEKRYERDTKKKKEEKKPADYMEDEDLEEEIDKLCSGGLKNRAHTLTLSRLMVRSRELEHRTRLLRVIQSGEQPCRRLFLDYHGLRLIWSYVMDIATNESEEAQQFRLEVLKTLSTLPIPNKTMLMDSKVYSVVERWSKRLYLSPNVDSPEDDQIKSKMNCEELNSNSDNSEKKSLDEHLNDIPDKSNNNIENCLAVCEIKSENTDQNLIPDLASSILAEWSNLKEVFRIPKKERIEQMKEHEREADRGYKEELEKEEKRSTLSYDRHRSDRYNRNEIDKRGDRRRGRESPEADHSRTKDKRIEERSLVPIPRQTMTKYERRQLFALKVAKEEEERQRRQQQESWQEHENRCLALGIDPHTTAMVDPQTGYPVFYNPTLGQWQHYSTQDGGEVTQPCTPVYVGSAQSTAIIGQNSHILPSGMTTDMSSGITTGIPPGVPPPGVAYSLSQTSVFNQTSSYSLISHPQPYTEGQLPLPNNHQFSNLTPVESVTSRPQPEISAIDLPPKWKSATDSRGRTYYYHVKERISQWLPPPPDHIGVQPDSSSTSESSEESSSSNEDDEDIDDDHNDDQRSDDMEASSVITESPLSTSRPNVSKKLGGHNPIGSSLPFPESKKRRDGLVQERIISPRREEDRIDHKAYKEIKEKLRRQKERTKLKDHVEKLRKHRRSNKLKSHSRHGLNKLQSTSAEMSPLSERKIKDTFRINMANVMVHFLNPYRKNDCKQGRITNTEDFKHLARKLTHFVLAKELKHCKSVDELQCNDNVKHKARDFVRKYMSKFGAVYQKSTDED
ncbi:LOW QUALITY PROTEIN: probable histone-lysine N-methyltransferase CG1716 [Monomorium pharaonis]|uniref:LOW QUALITY PROTEIN: probable histone-lysine N-methyltransferase CG1716 n=1 Tax=Monomorium pharaonis TaxID=307658 RepID=UPI00063FC513|nr:LOW QUALITY PROTEIN: probable histone-lysine N-methyltransferase CG1716 [Monomorium pharaonis]XP_036150541.1 LOW QUALITY PROTEIN: probable histone-lysine N-methyltransferase CG1716 [Monomorium pharaonis]